MSRRRNRNGKPSANGRAHSIWPPGFDPIAAGQYARSVTAVMNDINGPTTLERAFLTPLLDGNRDLDNECGYPPTFPGAGFGSINPELYRALYEREAIPNRVVNCLPKEAWQVTPFVFEDQDPDKVTAFEQAWDDLGQGVVPQQSWYQDEKGSPIWQWLKRADILSGMGTFGVILLGIDDGRNLDMPADGVSTLDPSGEPDQGGWNDIYSQTKARPDAASSESFGYQSGEGYPGMQPNVPQAQPPMGPRGEERPSTEGPNKPAQDDIYAPAWKGPKRSTDLRGTQNATSSAALRRFVQNARKQGVKYFDRAGLPLSDRIRHATCNHCHTSFTRSQLRKWRVFDRARPRCPRCAHGSFGAVTLATNRRAEARWSASVPKMWPHGDQVPVYAPLHNTDSGDSAQRGSSAKMTGMPVLTGWRTAADVPLTSRGMDAFTRARESTEVPDYPGVANAGAAPASGVSLLFRAERLCLTANRGFVGAAQVSRGDSIEYGGHVRHVARVWDARPSVNAAGVLEDAGHVFQLASGYIGTDAQYVGIQLSPPEYPSARPATDRRRLLFLRCFSEDLVQVVQYEANVRNPRFGMPVMYRITLNDPRQQHSGIGLPMATVRVHWSRIIHLADNLQSSEIFGMPRMQPVLNRLLDLRKLYAAGAEGYWKSCFAQLVYETYPQLGGDVEVDADDIQHGVARNWNTLQRALIGKGGSWKTLPPSVVDPTSQIEGQIQAICIQIAVPKRVFMGSERGELASSQDDAKWNDVLRERQNDYLTPRVIVPFVDRMISLGVLPEPEGYSVEWPDLDSQTDKDKAAIAVQTTQALQMYVAGQLESIITLHDYLVLVWHFTEEQAEQIVKDAQENQEQNMSMPSLGEQGHPATASPSMQGFDEDGNPIYGGDDGESESGQGQDDEGGQDAGEDGEAERARGADADTERQGDGGDDEDEGDEDEATTPGGRRRVTNRWSDAVAHARRRMTVNECTSFLAEAMG